MLLLLGRSHRHRRGPLWRALCSGARPPASPPPLPSMSSIVRARRTAEAHELALHVARERRRADERRRFGLPLFEFVLGGALAAGWWAWTFSEEVDASLARLLPEPLPPPPAIPPLVASLVHGRWDEAGEGARSAPSAWRRRRRLFVYGRPWEAAEVRCAECRRSLARADEPCFLDLDAASGAEVLLCGQHYAARHCAQCAVCGGAFSAGDAPVLLQSGDAMCVAHVHERPCYSCGRPLGRADAARRPLCTQCRSEAVVSAESARSLLAEHKAWFRALGLDFGRWQPAELRLVDAPPRTGQIDAGGHLEGLTIRSGPDGARAQRRGVGLGGGSARADAPPPDETAGRSVRRIELLHGLPRVHAGQVLAHELAHAWLWLQGVPPLERRTEEGVCELLAYLWLLSEDARLEAATRRGLGASGAASADDGTRRREVLQRIRVMELNQRAGGVYGGGFRDALQAAERYGLRAVLAHVREHGQLPKP